MPTYLQEGFKVGTASGQHHFVGFACLTFTSCKVKLKTQLCKKVKGGIEQLMATERDIRETLLIPQMLEGVDHVGLEVVPSQAKLLLIICHGHAV